MLMPQPNLVPGSLKWSRSTHSKGVCPSPSKATLRELRVNFIVGSPMRPHQPGCMSHASQNEWCMPAAITVCVRPLATPTEFIAATPSEARWCVTEACSCVRLDKA